MSDLETRVEEVADELMKFYGERCELAVQPGKANALLFALAAAQVIGSNFSLIDSDTAAKGLRLTFDRLHEWYAMGLDAGGPMQ